MPMPWTVKITFLVPEWEVEEHAAAYHLEDLVVFVQMLIDTNGLFRIELPVGPEPVEIETWADMLSRNYSGGEPEFPFPYLVSADIRNGGVIVKCVH